MYTDNTLNDIILKLVQLNQLIHKGAPKVHLYFQDLARGKE